METKRCNCCNEVKPASEFYKNKTNKDGLAKQCKRCSSDCNKSRYAANKDRWKAYADARTASGHVALGGIKRRAKKKGLDFDLELEDITRVTHCPVFGFKLERSSTGAPAKNSPSVDRKIPELGYVKDNIQVISNKANTMKSNATPEELLMFADWIYKTYQK